MNNRTEDLRLPLLPGPAAWLGVELPTVAENLALDEALLELAHEGLASAVLVRTWMPAGPVVVLGSSSRLAEEVDLDACVARGVGIVRRPSGGATVLLGPGCLVWSVVAPFPAGPPSVESIHAAALEPLARAINDLLPTSTTAAGRRIARRGTSDLALVEGDEPDAADGDRKVSGNALRVRRHGVLYHGTLLDGFDLGLVTTVLRHPPREPAYRSRRPHGRFLANLGLGRERLESAVRAAFNATLGTREWPAERVARLVQERYGATDWNGRL